MSTPTLRMLERQQEAKRRMDEAIARSRAEGMTRTTHHPALRALQRAAREQVQPAPVSMAPTAPTPAPSAAFWADLASEYVRGIQRPAPAVEAEPAPASTPPAKPMPREFKIHRDLDGRATHAQVGDQKLVFHRGRDGRIERADSDRHSIVYQRGLDGKIVGARLELKEEPKP